MSYKRFLRTKLPKYLNGFNLYIISNNIDIIIMIHIYTKTHTYMKANNYVNSIKNQ